MGQYKVPQNVESEDKILGPLTFKQFIYALIGVAWGGICFAIFKKIPVIAIVLGAPPTILFLLLAFYTRDGQNFEQILLSIVDFFTAPHKRIWVKEDLIETFHVEPTKVAAEVTQRSSVEVRGELEKLSNLMDSRGWNHDPDADAYQTPLPSMLHSERIVAPPPAPFAPDEPQTDMLDLQRSPLAQNLAELIREAAEDVRTEALNQMSTKPAKADPNTPKPILIPLASISSVTVPNPNDILKLATQSDNLTVSQLAAQATRVAPTGAMQSGPVVEVKK